MKNCILLYHIIIVLLLLSAPVAWAQNSNEYGVNPNIRQTSPTYEPNFSTRGNYMLPSENPFGGDNYFPSEDIMQRSTYGGDERTNFSQGGGVQRPHGQTNTARYKSNITEPFSDGGYGTSRRKEGIRPPDDPGQRDPNSPVGSPLVLVLMAVGYWAVRRLANNVK